MGLFDSIRRAVGGSDDGDDGPPDHAGGDTGGRAASEAGPRVVDTRSLGPDAFRERARAVADAADALDGSPASLERLDTALRTTYDGRAADTDDPGAYSADSVRFGSYLGTVLVDAYGGEWVDDDGWGVRVERDGDSATVAVFDVAARSLSDDPVFAAVADRLASDVGLASPDGEATAGADGAATAGAADDDPTDAPSATEAAEPDGRETDATPAAAAEPEPRPVTDAETGEPVDPATDQPESGSPAAAATDGTPASPPAEGLRAEYAETATDFAEFWAERELDFSPASLDRLDDLVAAEWEADRFETATFGSDADFDDRAFTSVTTELGSYFGEVLVRRVDGEWTDATDHEAAVVVEGVDRSYAVPVFQVAANSLRERPVFAQSYEALLADLGRDD
ncbi:hypothetical protein [Haloarcula litorea]|uniref:hypothetical protein n=1 Tax=Haloarcula litorea TaxID=3032579 RepID=UPI0023E75D8E|nr:hypothetical protein [Halomicroarcula sp. GDY20]